MPKPRCVQNRSRIVGILVQLVAEMNTFQENGFPFFCLLTHSSGIGNHNSDSPSGLFHTFFFIQKGTHNAIKTAMKSL